jgi:hypothetical protein
MVGASKLTTSCDGERKGTLLADRAGRAAAKALPHERYRVTLDCVREAIE